MTIPEAKLNLRRQVLERLRSLSLEAQQSESLAVCQAIRESAAWTQANSVMLYAPMTNELDVWPLVREAIATGKQLGLPRYIPGRDVYEAACVRDLERHLVIGKLGIREPVLDLENISLNQLDFIVVPGLAYSLDGYRLGRGKGYYDRLLAQANGVKCGVGFTFQAGWDVPVEPHDVRLNCIITPSHRLFF